MKLLEKNIIGAFGEQGKLWLQSLPTTINTLSAVWSLTALKPVNNMTWHYVAKGMKNNQPIVLKIGCDQKTTADEYRALMHFNGHRCIQLLAADLNYQALLLEQAIPGTLLKNASDLSFNEKVTSYAGVIKALADLPLPQENQFIHVSHWLRAIDKLTTEHFAQSFIDKAYTLRSSLLNTATSEYCCHGDLHLENIINHQSTWLAIDPKGIISERGFEAAAYDLISQEELSHYQQDSIHIILERINVLAHAIDIDINRLIAWVFLRVILSAQWFIEDKGDPTHMLSLARFLYPLT
ncbi:Aminoglycoside/hydroxyurea antibiotic resistance kinase [Legionella beliardensis]|uniref:Aminoglycoside/hydroxyurea antibiotic resistance kinase n=1 Tax=Legionella beliardensis TaxID=91822 RepID=A0A378HYB5_9GAMM|nr:aminoglycoside phosphotransferase family protein [Legionella beliardensis]STX27888.1 Aminoglycoside/hydroxyurea antibiotic resistance kinase [Legionella beliardensis]